jgi:fumarylpyruvate hydrolase
MTGTPAGVGPVQAGDHIVGEIEGLEPVSLHIEDGE